MSGSRLIYVDDSSPLISYQGQWDDGGNSDTFRSVNTVWGPPFKNTLHSLSGSGSFSFNFTGLSVSVIGSLVNPSSFWICYLDGNSIPSNNISGTSNLNNVEICSLSGIVRARGAKVTNLTVVASSNGNSFLFDRIQYEPDATVTGILDNATIVVDAFDGDIRYSSGWTAVGDAGDGLGTSVQNSFLNFDFVGTQITWMTFVAFNPPNVTINASGRYSIDNGTLFPFQVIAQSSTVQLYNLESFQTGPLSPGQHHLFVEYGVDNFVEGSAPLVLGYFIIQNQTFPSVTLSKGGIAGVVVGSMVGLALIIFGLIRYFKRKRSAASLGSNTANMDGY